MSDQSVQAQQALAGQHAFGSQQKGLLGKAVLVLKVVAFFVTFGFVFPTILEDL